MGAKRQEAINTQRPTDNATAAPGPKNDFSPTTLPRLAIYGALVGRATIARIPVVGHTIATTDRIHKHDEDSDTD
jgi:hypothetical protein